jgi:hypothetical protein
MQLLRDNVRTLEPTLGNSRDRCPGGSGVEEIEYARLHRAGIPQEFSMLSGHGPQYRVPYRTDKGSSAKVDIRARMRRMWS